VLFRSTIFFDCFGLDIFIFYSIYVTRVDSDGTKVFDGPVKDDFSDVEIGTFEDYANNAKLWCPNAENQKIVAKPFSTKKEFNELIANIDKKVDTIIILDHGGKDKKIDASYQFAGRTGIGGAYGDPLTEKEIEDILDKVEKKLILTGCECAASDKTKDFLDKVAKKLKIVILANEGDTNYIVDQKEKSFKIDTEKMTTFPRQYSK
jgi:hypothetical protein